MRILLVFFLLSCALYRPVESATSTVTQVIETTITEGLLVLTETITTTFVTIVPDSVTSQSTVQTGSTSNSQSNQDSSVLTSSSSVTNSPSTSRSSSSSVSSVTSTSSQATSTVTSTTVPTSTTQQSQTSDTSTISSSPTSSASTPPPDDPGTSTVTETQSGRQATQSATASKSSLGGGAIAGIVVAGIIALAVAAFVIWWCTRKRFGDLGGNDQDGDIKWPEMERNVTHLQPLPTKPSGSHGIAMGDTMSNPNRSALEDEDDDDLSGLDHSAHSGTALTQGPSGAGYYDPGFQSAQPEYSQAPQHDMYGMSPPRQNMYAPSTSPPTKTGYDQYQGGYR